MPQGTGHIDRLLTNLSIEYKPQAYIARNVYKPVPTDKQSDLYLVYGREEFKLAKTRRAPGTEANKFDWTFSNSPFYCQGHALATPIPYENIANQDPPLDLQKDNVRKQLRVLALRHEYDCVQQLVTDMTGAQVSDQTSTPWNDNANDPIRILKEKIDVIGRLSGVRPNALAISRPVFTELSLNSNVRGLITGAPQVQNALVKPEQIAQLLEIDNVYVANALYDTANLGQAAAMDYVWGSYALLYYEERESGLLSTGFGATFEWRKALEAIGGKQSASDIPNAGPLFVKVYPWDINSAFFTEVHYYFAAVTTAKLTGLLLTNCISNESTA